jgi:hypothetical protein
VNVSLSAWVTVLLGCCLCTGCIPVHEHYDRVEVANASYLKGLCGGFGPPSWAYYPFNGISISVSLSPGLQIGLHYPVGTVARFDSDTIEIRGLQGDQPFNLTAYLRPAVHHVLGNAAPERFDAMLDPSDANRVSGYRRSAAGRGYVWANFLARDKDQPDRSISIPSNLVRAVIVIPAMTVNGNSYGPQELPVVRRTYTGIEPVNC